MLFVVLVSISNDLSLRALGVRRWRAVQRSAYVVLALSLVHGALYQGSERQGWWLVAILLCLSAEILSLQRVDVRPHR